MHHIVLKGLSHVTVETLVATVGASLDDTVGYVCGCVMALTSFLNILIFFYASCLLYAIYLCLN